MAVSEMASDEVISLPIYPEMPDEFVDRVSEAVLSSVRRA